MEPTYNKGGWGYGGGRTGKKLKGYGGSCLDDLTKLLEAYSGKFVTFGVCHLGVSPKREFDVPTGSGGEPSSPNCGASAGVKARHLCQFMAYFTQATPHAHAYPQASQSLLKNQTLG